MLPPPLALGLLGLGALPRSDFKVVRELPPGAVGGQPLALPVRIGARPIRHDKAAGSRVERASYRVIRARASARRLRKSTRVDSVATLGARRWGRRAHRRGRHA